MNVQSRNATHNVVHLALAAAGVLMLAVAYLRWSGFLDLLRVMKP